MRTLILLALLSLPALAPADEIYRTTDEDGNTVYTNQKPSEDAEPVELEPLTTVPAGEAPPTEADTNGQGDAQAESDQQPRYQALRIEYPRPDQTIRHNGGLVPFRVQIEPSDAELAKGHRVEILLDGEVRGSGRSRQISVSAVNRGPHKVQARIVNQAGAAITSSDTVSFMLLRAALGDKAQQ